jgi:hypothetical protein
MRVDIVVTPQVQDSPQPMILTVPRSPARVKRLARRRVRSAGRRGRSAIVAALRGETIHTDW